MMLPVRTHVKIISISLMDDKGLMRKYVGETGTINYVGANNYRVAFDDPGLQQVQCMERPIPPQHPGWWWGRTDFLVIGEADE